MEQQLDIEMQIRKQAEALNEQLHTQMLECQREMEDVVIKCNSVSTIPDNCSLVSKEELKCLLQEYIHIPKIICVSVYKIFKKIRCL